MRILNRFPQEVFGQTGRLPVAGAIGISALGIGAWMFLSPAPFRLQQEIDPALDPSVNINEWRRNYFKLGQTQIKTNEIYQKTFSKSRDLHVTPDDILKIGRCLVGIRHVSCETQAKQNAIQGITDGCAINASFSGNRSPKYEDGFSFTGFLDDKVRAHVKCSSEIQLYERALLFFIHKSFAFDRSVLDSRFMVAGYKNLPSKCDLFEGLGRLGPETIPPKRVFPLSPPSETEFAQFQRALMPISDPLLKQELLNERMARWYLSQFLKFIRTDFDPNLFPAHFDTHHYEQCTSKDKDFAMQCLAKLKSSLPNNINDHK